MKGKFANLKLLCFLLISFFILGFGGEVKANENFSSRQQLSIRSVTYFQWIYNINNNQDAYCLEHSKMGPNPGGIMSLGLNNSILNANQKKDIINILRASQGLTGLSSAERYYITQAAIWYAKDGIGYDKGNGITQGFYNWIVTSKYAGAWNTLMNARKNAIVNPNIAIKGTKYTLEQTDNGMVSQDFYVAANGVNGNFRVKIDSGSAGASILYGNCTADPNHRCTTVDVPAGARFKIMVNTPQNSGEVNAKFTVTPLSAPSVYDINTYIGAPSSGWQSVAMLTSAPKTLSKTQVVKGNFVGDKEIQVQKVDKDTCTLDSNGNVTDFNSCTKVAGAEFYILDENGSKVKSVISTGPGEENPKIKLPIGNYTMVENAAPGGYYSSDDSVSFSVTADGVKDKDGHLMTGTVPTIYYSNSRIKIKFRKLDRDGNPMSGIKFKIYNATGVANGYLCAYTDENGYLTQACTGEDASNNVKSNGEYTIGLDFGLSEGIYQIEEVCETDSCKQYNVGGHSNSFGGSNDFYITDYGKQVVLFNYDLSLQYEGDSNTPIIVMNMINKNEIKITKTDVTTGKEIGGAEIVVTDPSIVDGDYIVDSWTSIRNVTHEVHGIVPGHKYRLTEENAPAGYIAMKTSIDFIMDEDGNVKTYDITTGEELADLKGTDYELLITNMPIKTVFSKTDAVTGEEIPGAHLKVCTKDAYDLAVSTNGDGNSCEALIHPHTDEVIEWTSEAGKEKTIEALPAGEYYLVETIAPEGYVQQTNAQQFTVIDDGSVLSVEMKNQPTKVTIAKRDKITNNLIAGAHMQLLHASDRSVVVDQNGNELTWVSSDTEPYVIYALPAGEYILVETMPPTGYQEGMVIDDQTMSEYKFTVSDQAGDINIDVDINVMNVPNTGISTLNLFAIGGLMVFIGYETIKIYRRKALN